MNTQSKLLIGFLSILFISYAGNFALSQETKSVLKDKQAVKVNLLTHEQIISEAQRSVDRSLTVMDHTITAIGVLVGLLTLIIVVIGGIFGFLGFRTFGSLRKDIEKTKEIAGKSEIKYKEAEETLNKIKPIADKIDKYEKDINSIKEKYENEFRNLSITEKPSGDTKDKLDELTRKFEFLEDIGVELEDEDYMKRGLDYYYKDEYEKAEEAFGKTVELKPDNAVAWYNKGASLSKLGKPEEALKFYDKAIGLKPDFANAWYNKACVYSLKGDKGKSLENLRKAIELDPKHKEGAKKDEDFKGLWDDEDFKKIVE